MKLGCLSMRNKPNLSLASGSRKALINLWRQSGHGPQRKLWWQCFLMLVVSCLWIFFWGMKPWILLTTVHCSRSSRIGSDTRDQACGKVVWMGTQIVTIFCSRTTLASTHLLRLLLSSVNRTLTWLLTHSIHQICHLVTSGCFLTWRRNSMAGILGLWWSSKLRSRPSSKESQRTCSRTASGNLQCAGKSVWSPMAHTLKGEELRLIQSQKLLTLQHHLTVLTQMMTMTELRFRLRKWWTVSNGHPWISDIMCTYNLPSYLEKLNK